MSASGFVMRRSDVVGCARCEGDHPGLMFERLEHPLTVRGVTFDWWAECPTNGQPILMVVFTDAPVET